MSHIDLHTHPVCALAFLLPNELPFWGSFCIGMDFHLGLILHWRRLSIDNSKILVYNGGERIEKRVQCCTGFCCAVNRIRQVLKFLFYFSRPSIEGMWNGQGCKGVLLKKPGNEKTKVGGA